MNTEDKKEFIDGIIKRIRSIDYIKSEDIPDIGLYMDQVTTFMNDHLSSLKRYEGDKVLTKTMINNYSKNKLLPSPDKKKYGKEHMFLLIFIYYFKNMLSIRDIQGILSPLTEQFFGKKGAELSLEDIYDEVFKVAQGTTTDITRTVLKEFNRAKGSFEDEEDEIKRKFLTDFSFIASLCFDIYIKKTIVENMIDRGVLDIKGNSGGKREKKK